MAMMPSGQTGHPRVEQDILIDPDDADLDDLDDPLQPATTSDRAPLTGNIGQPLGSGARSNANYLTSSIPGEDRRAPQNTIDESVWDTLSRDLKAVWEKMRQVLWPKYLLGGMLLQRSDMETGNSTQSGLEGLRGRAGELLGRWPDADAVLKGNTSDALKDWDLWGPLLFSLLLSFLLSRGAKEEQTAAVFSGVFAMIWLGSGIVTLQIKLLGGSISFFQSVGIIGYTLFPLVIAGILSAVGVWMIIRIPVYIVLVAWSTAAGVSILGGSGVVRNRVGIAVYPLLVFYVGLGALCFIT